MIVYQNKVIKMIKNLIRKEADKDKTAFGFLYFAGYRYWTASLLPALVGTTLPFWLNPPGFSFKWLGAIEFLCATVLFHAGFSFLHARFEDRFTTSWPKSRLFRTGITCLCAAFLIALHLNYNLQLNKYVHEYIFIIYVVTTIFIGVLYVAPPFSLCKRVGGETILSVGFGMVPVLGAYLIQVGDLTRTVYLASLPLVVSMGLWIWVSELVNRVDDEKWAQYYGYDFYSSILQPLCYARTNDFTLLNTNHGGIRTTFYKTTVTDSTTFIRSGTKNCDYHVERLCKCNEDA